LSNADARTQPERPYQEVIRDMAACAMQALTLGGYAPKDIATIGIGIPGIADNETGMVIFCTNLGWTNVPLRVELQKYLNRPVYIENDATVAGFAESVAGVSKNCVSSVFLTLGTGVGGGIVLNGRPWTGAHGVATEIGHITMEIDGIPCTCGKDGCLERYCSATAIIRMAREMCLAHPDCAIAQTVKGDLDNITAKTVIDLARGGDDIAIHLFHRYCRYLAIGINTIISFLDPEMVVLGGGVSHAGAFLLDTVRAKIPSLLMFKTMPYADIRLAELGNDAGIIGSAMLARISFEGGQFARAD
jgi:glucokinase